MPRYQNNCCTTQNIYEVVTKNNNLPVTIDEAYAHCHLDFLIGANDIDQDNWMTNAIKTAMSCFEAISSRTLMKTGFKTYRDCWQPCFELRKSPLALIDSARYNDTDNVEQTVDTADYYIQKDPAYSLIRFDESFDSPALKANRPQQITIEFTAGYAADETEVPADIKQAILQQVCYMSTNRGDCSCGDGMSSAKASGASAIYAKYEIMELML
jgi:uncharacterized phiE125 gp8 family phage protein